MDGPISERSYKTTDLESVGSVVPGFITLSKGCHDQNSQAADRLTGTNAIV
jgi:hypothetical protein